MLSESDNDDYDEYVESIINLRNKIKERISIYNYLPICINVMWIVENYVDEEKQEYDYYKISLCVMVLDSIQELKQMKNIHSSMIENLYKLVENRKLEYFQKKKSIFQIIMSWIL